MCLRPAAFLVCKFCLLAVKRRQSGAIKPSQCLASPTVGADRKAALTTVELDRKHEFVGCTCVFLQQSKSVYKS